MVSRISNHKKHILSDKIDLRKCDRDFVDSVCNELGLFRLEALEKNQPIYIHN